MKKISGVFTDIFFMLLLLVSCNIIKSLPTNTSTGIFSLNGNWRMESSSDHNALAGSTISVYPISGDGIIATLQNNSYCVRANDVIWKTITSNNAGTFNISNLVNSCSSSLVYKPAMVTVVTNDEVRLSGTTASGTELMQTWKRTSR
ncbi:MAG: hypothetical protein JWQ78_709 [Sediminibacterium sp.]|nr:hypothetical protein [Sediminibacterium sp.]